MNVNEKGVKGLIKVMDDLSDRGLYNFPAFDDHSPVDLIIMNKQGELRRMQVKYRTPMPGKRSERYELHARSMVNGKVVPIDRSLIDGWAVYMAGCKQVKYISVSALEGKNQIVIDPEKSYGELDEWLKSAPC